MKLNDKSLDYLQAVQDIADHIRAREHRNWPPGYIVSQLKAYGRLAEAETNHILRDMEKRVSNGD